MNLVGRNFLTLKDFTPEEIMYMIDLAADLKDRKKKGIPVDGEATTLEEAKASILKCFQER